MHRYTWEPLTAGRNVAVEFHPHRGQSLTGISKDLDENLDLFSKNRLSLSIPLSDDSSDVSTKLGRLSVGSVKLAKSGIDELLSSTEGGKHDYDWLLTPPGTPLLSPSNGSESKLTQAAPRRSSSVRSSSTTKASRLSVSQSESNHSSRPTRSSSVTRSSSSTLQNGSYSTNRSLTILNTSSVSVSSYTRPSSPITRTPSLGRPSTPSSRPGPTRSLTPSRIRPATTSSSVDKTQPLTSSRPSTPSSRPHIPANLGSSAPKSTSHPSTPTRRNSVSSLSTAPGPATSAIRSLSNGHSTPASSRPSSPSPRVRPPPQPIVPPDFPLDTPPNLRTSLPDRPVSAGRSRPGAAVTLKGNTEARASLNMARRASSPTGTRGRLMNQGDASEPRKASHNPETTAKKAVKALTSATDSTGFGRTISKKSLDMAIRHMDIRNGSGNGIRQLSTTTLFPQSIRSATSKTQPIATSNALAPVKVNSNLLRGNNGFVQEQGNHCRGPSENGSDSNVGRFSAKLSELDIYESTRYDAILLKEDAKNTNWLHSVDNRSDAESIFDNGFESLPEPFACCNVHRI